MQARLAQVAHHAPGIGQRDRAGLLGDDHGDGVGDLGDADRGAMAGADVLDGGRRAPAAARPPRRRRRSPWMMTAPSWSGEFGQKMLSSSSVDSSASMATPLEANSPSGVERSMTSSAPKRRSANCCAARGDGLGQPGIAARRRSCAGSSEPARPSCSSARRISGANSTGITKISAGIEVRSRNCSMVRLKTLLSTKPSVSRIRMPRTSVAAEVPGDQAEQPVQQQRDDDDVQHRAEAETAREATLQTLCSSAERALERRGEIHRAQSLPSKPQRAALSARAVDSPPGRTRPSAARPCTSSVISWLRCAGRQCMHEHVRRRRATSARR